MLIQATSFAEVIARLNRPDAGLTFEYSNLQVSGDTQSERTLQFLKPSLVLDWNPGERTLLADMRDGYFETGEARNA